ncbi:MAG: type II toxin-antitoxin system Phd/YefM family antitoxin [Acidimicrobiia bacterium]|nr:type II toxin-antitoxin system Phd/YefM family antitoxin [Acidimicrobiia bacterium]
MSRIVTASDFRARCLKLMDEVSESGQEIVMTKHGRPVARLVPYQAQPLMKKPETLFGIERTVGDQRRDR